MITDRKTTIGYYCPFCGSSVLNRIDIFSMSNNLLKLKCICKESELIMQVTKDKKVRITVPCIVCPVNHSFTVSSSAFFEKDLFYFTCTFTAVGICFFGESGKVAEAMKKNEEELIKMFMAYDEYDNIGSDDDDDYAYSPHRGAGEFKAVKIGAEDDEPDDGGNAFFSGVKNYENGEDEEYDDYDDEECDEDYDWFDDDIYFGDDSGFMGDVDAFFDSILKSDAYSHESNITNPFASFNKRPPFEVYKSGGADGVNGRKKNDKKQKKQTTQTTQTTQTKQTAKTKKKDGASSGDVDFDKLKIKSPHIFEQILSMLYTLIEEERIDCNCHSEVRNCAEFISLAIQEDKIIVECTNCNAKREIKAVSSADLEYFADIEVFCLDND